MGGSSMRLQRVEDFFFRLCDSGAFPGGQLAVVRDGELVLSTARGVARGWRTPQAQVPYSTATRGSIFSASKGLVAAAMASLEERGELDVSARVAQYWPEFAQNGKASVTVRQVLVHRTGLMFRELTRHPERTRDWEAAVRQMEEEAPTHPPGTQAYQAFGFGWLCMELVRRITGKTMDEVLEERFFAPMGLRISPRAEEGELGALAQTYWTGSGEHMLDGENLVPDFERFHDSREYLTARAWGALAVTNAEDLARFYGMCARGGLAPDGKRLLSEETLRRWTTPEVLAWDRTIRSLVRFGRGFALGWLVPHLYGSWNTSACFGHPGGFCTVGFADPRHRLGVAMVTNGNAGVTHLARWASKLSDAIRAAAK